MVIESPISNTRGRSVAFACGTQTSSHSVFSRTTRGVRGERRSRQGGAAAPDEAWRRAGGATARPRGERRVPVGRASTAARAGGRGRRRLGGADDAKKRGGSPSGGGGPAQLFRGG